MPDDWWGGASYGFTVGHQLTPPGPKPSCMPDESTYNPIGTVHGGLLCTLLDSAAGCAVQTLLPAAAGYGTIELKVSFLKPLQANSGQIEASGHALRVGRRVAFAEAHARDRNGELVGHATTSIAVISQSRRRRSSGRDFGDRNAPTA